MTGQTIQQLKEQPQSLWQFFAQVPASMEAQIFYALMLAGIFGVMAHYFVKWMQGDIAGSLLGYLFIDNPRRTLLAMTVVVVELAGEVGTNLFTTDTGAFVGWALVMASGFKSGYFGDSLANKGKRAEWTDEQRAAASAQTPPQGAKP